MPIDAAILAQARTARAGLLTKSCEVQAADATPDGVGFVGAPTVVGTVACDYAPIPAPAAAGLIEVLGGEPGYAVRFAFDSSIGTAVKGGDLIAVDGLILKVVRAPQPDLLHFAAEALCVRPGATG